MTALRRLARPALLLTTLVLATFLPAGTNPALAADDGHCRRVNAVGVGQAGPDVNSTTAVITRDGLLKGTTAATFAVEVGATPPVLPFAGDIVFTTHRGTLTLHVTGTLNTNTGDLQAVGPITSGTGRFTGATGLLRATGTQDRTGAFTETITGTVCLDKDH